MNEKTFFSKLIYIFIFTMMFGNTTAQDNWSSIKTATIRLKPGDDLKKSLDDYISSNHIKASCILSCVGSLQEAVIRFADKKEAATWKEKLEIVSLSGTLSIEGSHLHISVSDGNGKTTGGHLKEGCIIYTTAEIVIGILPDVTFTREVAQLMDIKS